MSIAAPKTFRIQIEQVVAYHESGATYTQMHDIVNDGADHIYRPEPWETWTDEERREHDEWMEAMHDAQIEKESAMPEVRSLIKVLLDEIEAKHPEWPANWADDARHAIGEAESIRARDDYDEIVAMVPPTDDYLEDHVAHFVLAEVRRRDGGAS